MSIYRLHATAWKYAALQLLLDLCR